MPCSSPARPRPAQPLPRPLANRNGAIIPLIAETGGQNAMIVDSSALPEQVTRDVVASAFQSAGQRCSALRVLFVQDDVADTMLAMSRGAAGAARAAPPAARGSHAGATAAPLGALSAAYATGGHEDGCAVRKGMGVNCVKWR